MPAISRYITVIFLISNMLIACQYTITPGANKNIRPAQTTNQIALSNLNLGIAYIKERNFEKALEKLDKAKKADPEYSPVYNVYGLLYQQLGQLNKAEENFKRAIRLNDNDSSTLNNYGRFLCQQKRIDEAETAFLQAADNPLYETPEIAITNAGLCFDNNGLKDKAVKYYREALTVNPQMSPALLKMCEISVKEQDFLAARGYLQRYEAVARHIAKSLWLGIQIENKLGDKDAVSSYALLLKNSFPESNEAILLKKSGIR